jgi:hypothetical protein
MTLLMGTTIRFLQFDSDNEVCGTGFTGNFPAVQL